MEILSHHFDIKIPFVVLIIQFYHVLLQCDLGPDKFIADKDLAAVMKVLPTFQVHFLSLQS